MASENSFGILLGFVFLFLVNVCTLRLQTWATQAIKAWATKNYWQRSESLSQR